MEVVGIGTSSPQQLLHVNGTMLLGDLRISPTPVSFRFWANIEPQDTAITFHHKDLGHTDHWWRDVYALNFLGPSDLRYKREIQTLNYGLDAILKLRPVSFIWKHEKQGKKRCGLIAQELIEVIPEIVHNDVSQAAIDGNPSGYIHGTL